MVATPHHSHKRVFAFVSVPIWTIACLTRDNFFFSLQRNKRIDVHIIHGWHCCFSTVILPEASWGHHKWTSWPRQREKKNIHTYMQLKIANYPSDCGRKLVPAEHQARGKIRGKLLQAAFKVTEEDKLGCERGPKNWWMSDIKTAQRSFLCKKAAKTGWWGGPSNHLLTQEAAALHGLVPSGYVK